MPLTRDDNKSRDVLTKGRRKTTTGSTLSARDVVRFLPIIGSTLSARNVVRFLPIIAMQTNRDVQGVYMCRIFN